jgi:hypothetical protein
VFRGSTTFPVGFGSVRLAEALDRSTFSMHVPSMVTNNPPPAVSQRPPAETSCATCRSNASQAGDSLSKIGRIGLVASSLAGVISALAAAATLYFSWQQTALASREARTPVKIAFYADSIQTRRTFIEAYTQFDNALRKVMLTASATAVSDAPNLPKNSRGPALSAVLAEKFSESFATYRGALNATAYAWPASDRQRFADAQTAAEDTSACFLISATDRQSLGYKSLGISPEDTADICSNLLEKIENFGVITNGLLRWMQTEIDAQRKGLDAARP